MPQRRLLDAQLVDLVLGEVADAQRLRADELAGEDARPALPRLLDDGLEEGRFARAVGAEEADRVAGQHAPLDAREHGALSISDRSFLETEELPRPLARRGAELEQEGRIHVGGGDALHLLQRLDAALRLARLGRLRAEARDELLEML